MLECCEDRTVPSVVSLGDVADATEGEMPGYIDFYRDGDISQPITVNFTVGGTATSGTDYSSIGTSVSFGAYSDTAFVYVTANDDATSEPTETVSLTLATGTGYLVGTPASASIDLYDNDAQVVTVAKLADATEGGGGTFRFTRIGDLSSSLGFDYSVSGSSTATQGTDYTLPYGPLAFGAGQSTYDVQVTALPDNLVEGTETVIVSVASGTGYTPGSPSSATVDITDDPPVVTVTGADTFEGAATGGFSFTRSGGDLAATLTVSYTVGGTTTSGTDYTALSGSVVFAANEDRVEVPVEAFGDNTNDDGETVIVTISSGGTSYTIDSEFDEATVTIADQPLTVVVYALTDGEEGASNGSFRVQRFGDLSQSLTVYYTVTGTAGSGADFTALSGSVTFAATDDEEDVIVYVTDDGIGEPTETVIVTLEEDEDYLLGNDSDSIFIKDNDTTRVTWQGDVALNPNDWNEPDNWDTGSVPQAGDDVYFNGSISNVTCGNVGYGLSTLYGLHIVGAYSGTLTLANELSVGTFEQLSGTLDQPSARHLTITDAMLWSGGTLNASATGAEVKIDEGNAFGRIDPPDSGSMSIASTLKVLNGVVTILPGTLDFLGGDGMYIADEVKWFTRSNTNVEFTNPNGTSTKVEIATDAKFSVKIIDKAHVGGCTSALPIQNAGQVWIDPAVELHVNGHVEGGTTPSLLQTGGRMTLWSGGKIKTEFGMAVTGGEVQLWLVKANTIVTLVGDLKFDAGASGVLTFINPFGAAGTGRFDVAGNVTWISGTYKPNVDFDIDGPRNEADLWFASGSFKVGPNAKVDPDISNAPEELDWRTILRGEKGVKNLDGNAVTPPALPAGIAADFELRDTALIKPLAGWDLLRK